MPSRKPVSETQPAAAPSDVNQLITPFPRVVPVPDEVKTPSADSIPSRELTGLGAGVAANPLSIANVTAPAAKPIPAAPASTLPIANPSPSPMPSQVPLGDLSVNSRLLQSMQTLPNGRRVLPESKDQDSNLLDGSATSSLSSGAADAERSSAKNDSRQSSALEEAIILQPADLLRASSGGSSSHSDVRRLVASPNPRGAALPPALNLRDTISKGKSPRNSMASPLVFLPVRGKASARNQVNTSPFGPLPTTDRMSSAQPGRD